MTANDQGFVFGGHSDNVQPQTDAHWKTKVQNFSNAGMRSVTLEPLLNKDQKADALFVTPADAKPHVGGSC